MPCEICGSTTKQPNTKGHIKTNRHQTALKLLGTKKAPSDTIQLEQRVGKLEKQVHDILQLLRSKQLTTASEGRFVDHNEVRQAILRQLQIHRSMTIDQLFKSLRYPWDIIEKILKELINKEILDGADAPSSKKLYNRYGRVIKR